MVNCMGRGCVSEGLQSGTTYSALFESTHSSKPRARAAHKTMTSYVLIVTAGILLTSYSANENDEWCFGKLLSSSNNSAYN